jgi:hypothetical protein
VATQHKFNGVSVVAPASAAGAASIVRGGAAFNGHR